MRAIFRSTALKESVRIPYTSRRTRNIRHTLNILFLVCEVVKFSSPSLTTMVSVVGDLHFIVTKRTDVPPLKLVRFFFFFSPFRTSLVRPQKYYPLLDIAVEAAGSLSLNISVNNKILFFFCLYCIYPQP